MVPPFANFCIHLKHRVTSTSTASFYPFTSHFLLTYPLLLLSLPLFLITFQPLHRFLTPFSSFPATIFSILPSEILPIHASTSPPDTHKYFLFLYLSAFPFQTILQTKYCHSFPSFFTLPLFEVSWNLYTQYILLQPVTPQLSYFASSFSFLFLFLFRHQILLSHLFLFPFSRRFYQPLNPYFSKSRGNYHIID